MVKEAKERNIINKSMDNRNIWDEEAFHHEFIIEEYCCPPVLFTDTQETTPPAFYFFLSPYSHPCVPRFDSPFGKIAHGRPRDSPADHILTIIN